MATESNNNNKVVHLENKINQLEVDVSALKEKVSFFSVIYGKFDETLNRMAEMMEDRRSEINDDLKDVYAKIKESEDKMVAQFTELRRDMKELHEEEKRKIENIDKWRWMMIGGATALGYFISNLADKFTV